MKATPGLKELSLVPSAFNRIILCGIELMFGTCVLLKKLEKVPHIKILPSFCTAMLLTLPETPPAELKLLFILPSLFIQTE